MNKNKIWAVVPSAGSGKRMLKSMPKQYLELQGRTVIEHTLLALLSEQRVAKVVVCIAEGDPFWSKLDCANDPRVKSTLGGATRADSVLNGINTLSDKAHDDDWVLVHDAARPCLSEEMLASFVEQLSDHEIGGLLALPSNDTVKLSIDSESQAQVERTLDRTRIWHAQTPQMFRYGLLKQALQNAIQMGTPITDEASAMELLGHHPVLIKGELRNLKVTRTEDLEMANLLIS